MTETQQPASSTGGRPPDALLIRLSGVMFLTRELERGEEIHLQAVDANGEVVADAYGQVVQVAFKDIFDKKTGDLVSTERIHSLKAS